MPYSVSLPFLFRPIALLDGTFNGLRNETTGIIYFRGVRFADPPVGNLRWKAPVVPPTKHLRTVSAVNVRHLSLFICSNGPNIRSSGTLASRHRKAQYLQTLRKTASLEM